ncbi:cobyrinate a,c-diamide synthase [Shewanella livingstonensis]|uniref:Cobyrinate a,c-diamide synthase n=1 Tax=Shewanella livingstonensis TaxID=150120 RepID=A0A3G8LUP6_9GAMM|nr:cobyrinate a,c-diamide synthase [Shewanella livingstonensis]AZG73299.1 cobyrinate a,c-diamide synthase [Shewanella livingstonensis]
MEKVMCPALFITAPSSDSGKTTVVAAMARYWRNKGKKVRVFKTGPDFIDPKFHEIASGQPAYQLDLGMMGEAICRRHLYQAAKDADLILIEGVMGMFDGTSSSADLAAKFAIPMLAVIPAAKMAQTFGAIAYGLAHYRKDVTLFGVVANKVGSVGHAKLLQQSIPDGIAYCGYLPRDEALALPDRHLGLVQAQEIPQLDSWLDTAASLLGESCDMTLPQAVSFEYEPQNKHVLKCNQLLKGQSIAVACDAAFAFIYHDNLSLLQNLGAELCLFSPLTDALPDCDSLYLPGGYPELHGRTLQQNHVLMASVQQHVASNKPVVAECGGMLFLLDTLTDKQNETFHFAGVLPGNATMKDKLQGIGILQVSIADELLKGHCFHYSTSDIKLQPIATAISTGRFGSSEAVYQHGSVIASYVHWYFASAPQVVANWFLGSSLPKHKIS